MEENAPNEGFGAESGFSNLMDNLMTEEELKAKLSEIKKTVTDFVREKPLVSIAAAVATGYILGKILKR